MRGQLSLSRWKRKVDWKDTIDTTAVGASMSFADRTESNSRQRDLPRVLNALDHVVIELDGKGAVLGANSAAEQLLGLTPQQMQKRNLNQLLSPRLVPARNFGDLADGLRTCQAKVCGEAIYDHPSGRRRLLRWCITPLFDGGVLSGYVVTFCDLTPLQNAESDFVAVIEDFLSVIQHRLRTPVLANLRINDLLLDGAFGALDEKQAEVLTAVGQNSVEIDRLLRILLDLYKYKNRREKLQTERLLLNEALREAVANLRTLCERAKLQLHVVNEIAADDVYLNVDRAEINKLFQHISENAVRHARSSVTIRITRSVDKALVSVADDGTGISPEDVSHLFTRFYQASADGRYAPATGAGLCLCAEIARAHGGSLSCKSRLNEGTNFTLALQTC
jgi:NtrC-family two-component system sensor histidine kinase KinB